MRNDKAKPIHRNKFVGFPITRPFRTGYLNPRIDNYRENRPCIGFIRHGEEDRDDGEEITVMPYGRRK